jgi:2-polyprenyl-6-methoxyphenol hydroxylase-like FAD-dependent oxidoreductase
LPRFGPEFDLPLVVDCQADIAPVEDACNDVATPQWARGFLLWLQSEETHSMGVDHAWEKFSNAIRFALVSDASLQERLGWLISEVGQLQRDSFPDERAWEEFRKLVNESTKRRVTNGSAPASISQMSDEEAKERLEMAFDIFARVAKAFGRTEFVI